MTPQQFISKWSGVSLSERSASQQHFLDLCDLLSQPKPAAHDKDGSEYTFEKSVAVSAAASAGSKGERGFVDVWWRNKFAWEYKRKGKHKTLDDAYRQLLQYREAVGNPPLLIVSDIERIEVHTNFTGTPKIIHTVWLDSIAQPDSLDILRRIFTDPASFRPGVTAEQITADAAKQFATLADSLRKRGHDGQSAAHFLMKCMFCLFAEDVGLLPAETFHNLVKASQDAPNKARAWFDELFSAMRTGGHFWGQQIAHFNGGLFDDAPALELTPDDLNQLAIAAAKDWAAVEPAIFGTLFERSLDPAKRSQIGAHYTSRDDILLVVEPVVMAPLRREWEQTRADIEAQLERRRSATTKKTKKGADDAIGDLLDGFLKRLASVRILDPACGSGNFLYVAIRQVLELEKEVITFAARPEIQQGLIPHVRPTQLLGIEINPYAAELAQVVIWIGYLQWMRDNGFNPPRDPILAPLQTIERRDAILAWEDEEGNPIPEWRPGAVCKGAAQWPEADFIIGNPPFLGTKMLRGGLGDAYVESMFATYREDVSPFADLCCYWFELALRQARKARTLRAGLLGTQAIRNTRARRTLQRIIEHSHIFLAWSDRPWVLDGAAVHIAIVGFGASDSQTALLDGVPTGKIDAALRSGASLTETAKLEENRGLGFIGSVKGGSFDIPCDKAAELLSVPSPNGRSPRDVLKPRFNAADLSRRPKGGWIIDFGMEEDESRASQYGAAFEYVVETVKAERAAGRPTRPQWWLHMRPGHSMRQAIGPLARYVITGSVSKYRLFQIVDAAILPDHTTIAFARSDDYFLGVLHASTHELWARRMGTQLREAESGFRYTPTTCFETFPLPWPPGEEPQDDPLVQRIADAARELDELREEWLNPPAWLAPIEQAVDREEDFSEVQRVSGPEAAALIRRTAIMARAAADPKLKKRTLTNLYNQRPTWLRQAHEKLDRAVIAAYAATDPAGHWDQDWARVWIDTGAGQPLPEGHPLEAQRAETEPRILENLLRLNRERSGADAPPAPKPSKEPKKKPARAKTAKRR